MFDNKFFTMIRPYLNYIDAGKLYKQPFKILYMIIAVLMLIMPFVMLYRMIDGHVFSMTAGLAIAAILIWIVFAAAGWFSFQLWWNRADDVQQTSHEGDEFVATPVISHLIQTTGEWFGSYLAGVGFLMTLISWLLGGGDGMNYLMYSIAGTPGSPLDIIRFPIIGFLIIVFSRWIAEMIRALVAIANNTKRS